MGLVIISLVFGGFMIPAWIRFSGSVLTFDVDYDSSCIFGEDSPVSDLDIVIKIDGVYSETLTTDMFGQAEISFTTIGEYTYSIEYLGVVGSDMSIDESMSQTIDLEQNTFVFDNDNVFYWDDMSLYSGAIDLYLDGIFTTTITINDVNGKMASSLIGLTLGDWSFENQVGLIVIDQSTVSPIITDVVITPKGIIISIINQTSRIIINN